MASGAAVIASEAGAWKDIIRDGIDGAIVPCDDLSATQNKLDTMMNHPDRLVEMGKEGRKHVEEHYTIEREAKALCDFFKGISTSPSHQTTS